MGFDALSEAIVSVGGFSLPITGPDKAVEPGFGGQGAFVGGFFVGFGSFGFEGFNGFASRVEKLQ